MVKLNHNCMISSYDRYHIDLLLHLVQLTKCLRNWTWQVVPVVKEAYHYLLSSFAKSKLVDDILTLPGPGGWGLGGAKRPG